MLERPGLSKVPPLTFACLEVFVQPRPFQKALATPLSPLLPTGGSGHRVPPHWRPRPAPAHPEGPGRSRPRAQKSALPRARLHQPAT